MIWNICFVISVAILFFAVSRAFALRKKYKSGRLLTPFYTLFIGVFFAVFVGLIPMFVTMLANEPGFVIKLCLFDALQTIQVFTINVGADLILDNINSATTSFSGAYSIYMTCLFFLAPILTFGFLASLLKNVFVNLAYFFRYTGDVYAFSELNEKALVLAQSIMAGNKNAVVVFTNVDNEDGDRISEYVESAKELGAVIFPKDIVAVDLKKHSKKAQINLFAIGEKEGDNLILSLKLLEKYRHRKNTGLYVFSSGAEGEMLLSNTPEGEIKVRRVNEIRSLVYNFLYNEGVRVFESAHTTNNIKEINAVILGLGKYGSEMIKALTWYCQMDGYSVTIDAFDRDELAEEKFSAMCPELMSEKYNGVHVPGESEYTIHIHSRVDVTTKTFADCMATLPRTTFVFVCLGNDADNINQAANIRMLCERSGCKPIIKTVVYSSDETAALSGITNYRGQEYGIEALGDFESTYSEEILLGSELERLALERHLKWGQEKEFWQYEYNYRSSLASAIHMKAKILCGIPGMNKKESELTEDERDTIEVLEHKRWNAYMRSEGYIYSGSPEKSSRNDLGKMHHDLVDFESLTEEEKRKDSSVGTR